MFGGTTGLLILSATRTGRLAQLVRALARHARGRRFESSTAHSLSEIQRLAWSDGISRVRSLRHVRLLFQTRSTPPPGVVTLEPATGWLHRLRDVVAQVIVTVNPHEFHGAAAATGLDSQVDLIVTSADVRSTSKVVQAQQARRWLGLDEDLTSTLLVDSKEADIAEFCEHGGQAVLFAENDTALDDLLLPLVS